MKPWAVQNRVAENFGYEVSFRPIGEEDQVTGSPTQMAVFTS